MLLKQLVNDKECYEQFQEHIDELIQTSLCNVLMYVCTMQPLVGHDAIFSALTGLTRLFDYRTYEVS